MKQLFVILTLFVSIQLSAQCPTDLILNSQAEVNAWPASCTDVIGTISIIGSDILDLSPLSGIESISGDLIILSTINVLSTVDGFNGLISVGGTIIIAEQPFVNSILGFESLLSAGDIIFQRNPSLTSINGFNCLVNMGSLNINNNSSLTDICGFNSLSTAFDFAITDNPILTSVEGFEQLSIVSGVFSLIFNPLLSDCCFINPFLVSGSAGFFSVAFNSTGCNSFAEIISNGPCLSPPSCMCAPPVCTYTFDAAFTESCGIFTCNISNIIGEGNADPVTTEPYTITIGTVSFSGLTGTQQLSISDPSFIADGSTTFDITIELDSDPMCISEITTITAPAPNLPNAELGGSFPANPGN